MPGVWPEEEGALCVKDELSDSPSEGTMSPKDYDEPRAEPTPLDQGDVETLCGFGGCRLTWNHPGLCEVPVLPNVRSRNQPKRLSPRLQGAAHSSESEQEENPEEGEPESAAPVEEPVESAPQTGQERRSSSRNASESSAEQDAARSPDADATPKRCDGKRKRDESQPPPPKSGGLLTEVDGLQLHLSKQSTTGYKGVVDCSKPGQERNGRPFKAQATAGQVRPLGYFATKLEAAICYAKWALEEKGPHAASTPAPSKPKKKKSSAPRAEPKERRAPTLAVATDQLAAIGGRAGGRERRQPERLIETTDVQQHERTSEQRMRSSGSRRGGSKAKPKRKVRYENDPTPAKAHTVEEESDELFVGSGDGEAGERGEVPCAVMPQGFLWESILVQDDDGLLKTMFQGPDDTDEMVLPPSLDLFAM